MNALNSNSGSPGMAQPNTSARMVGKLALGAAVLAATLVAGAPAAQATFNRGLVDFQFISAGQAPTTASGPAVIGSAGDVWNNEIGNSNSGDYTGSLALNLATGGASGATVTNLYEYSTPPAYIPPTSSPSAPSQATVTQVSADPNLLASILHCFETTQELYLTISGLNSAESYNLYLYNVSDGTQDYQVTGATTLTGNINPTSAASSFVSGENYYEFTLKPNTSGDILVYDTAATSDALSGFQLQAVPEPASLGLLAVGGLGLLLLKRHRMA